MITYNTCSTYNATYNTPGPDIGTSNHTAYKITNPFIKESIVNNLVDSEEENDSDNNTKEGFGRRRRRRRRRRRKRKLLQASRADPATYHCPSYLARYGDLRAAFGSDCNNDNTALNAYKHYGKHGRREGRNASKFDSRCYFQINGNCGSAPKMSNKKWFADKDFGGPEPLGEEQCQSRKGDWERFCRANGNDKTTVEMHYTNGKSDIIGGSVRLYENGELITEMSGAGSSIGYTAPRPTKAEFDEKQQQLKTVATEENRLSGLLYKNYDNKGKGLVDLVKDGHTKLMEQTKANSDLLKQSKLQGGIHSNLSNNISDMTTGFPTTATTSNTTNTSVDSFTNLYEGLTQKEKNQINTIRNIHEVDRQSRELEYEITKRKQKNMTYESKANFQKSDIDRLRFMNQHVLIYAYYIFAIIVLYFLLVGDFSLTRKIVYICLLFAFPFIAYPLERFFYSIYHYLTSFIYAVPYDLEETT